MPKMIGVQSYRDRVKDIEQIEYENSIRNAMEIFDAAEEDFWYEETHNEPEYWNSLFKHPHE